MSNETVYILSINSELCLTMSTTGHKNTLGKDILLSQTVF